MDHRWLIVRDHRELLVSVDIDAPLSAAEAETLADSVTSTLLREHINEVVLIGPKRFSDTSRANFHEVVRTVGRRASAADTPLRIAL